MLSVSPTNSESTTSEVKVSAPKEPVEFVNPMALSAAFRFRKMCSSTRPGSLADLRTFELPLRVFRQRPPEAILIGTRCHVVDEDIVRIGDPVSRHRVVRRQQGVLAGKAGRPVGRAILVRKAVLSVW